ncbi:Ldh family oxidoreductase [Vibrio mediterranei]
MKLSYEQLKAKISSMLVLLGLDSSESNWVADVLIASELRGDKSHGVNYIYNIINVIKNPLYVSSAPILQDSGAITVLDGKYLVGPLAAKQAIDIALDKATEHGIAAVSIRSSNHLFSLSYYARFIAMQDMIGFIFSSSCPAMAAPNTLIPVIGTNPFAFGAPSVSSPIVVDMSSTKVARGRIKEHQNKGTEIPSSWALDELGNPTTSPEAALHGSLQPIGEYKGFAIGCIVDILSSVLSGSAFSTQISGSSLHKKEINTEIRRKGDFILVLDIQHFMELNIFKSRMESFKNIIRKNGGYVPGTNYIENCSSEIEVDPAIFDKHNVD